MNQFMWSEDFEYSNLCGVDYSILVDAKKMVQT